MNKVRAKEKPPERAKIGFGLQTLLMTAIFSTFPAVAAPAKIVSLIFELEPLGKVKLSSVDDDGCIANPVLQKIPALKKIAINRRGCATFSELTDAGFTITQFSQLKLVVIQKIKEENTVTEIDEGINAGFINYDLTRTKERSISQRGISDNYQLTAGANYNGWMLRHSGTYDKQNDLQGWRNGSISVSRNFLSSGTLLRLGDGTSNSDIFSSNPRTGVAIYSDDRLLPKGKRPVMGIIQGIARTAAEVTIQQGDRVLLRKRVKPGNFTFKDVEVADSENILMMMVRETDGTATMSTIPLLILPTITAERNIKYDLFVGRTHPEYWEDSPEIPYSQLTAVYGINKATSVYGGYIYGQNYLSNAVGLGVNLRGAGLVSIDYKGVSYQTPSHDNKYGDAIKLRYAVGAFGGALTTNIQSSFYPNSKYLSITEYAGIKNEDPEYPFMSDMYAKRQYQLEANLQYNFLQGSLFSSLSNTWDRDSQRMTLLTSGLSVMHKGIDYSMFIMYMKGSSYSENRTVNLNVGIPLGIFEESPVRLQPGLNINNGKMTKSVALSGSALRDSSLSYNSRYNEQYHETAAFADYQYSAGDSTLRYTNNSSTERVNFNQTGSVVLHSQGVTFGQHVGDTFGIACIEQMPGVGIINQIGLTTDRQGCAVISNFAAYNSNRVSVDQASLPAGKMLANDKEIYPAEGAIVLRKYQLTDIPHEEQP